MLDEKVNATIKVICKKLEFTNHINGKGIDTTDDDLLMVGMKICLLK